MRVDATPEPAMNRSGMNLETEWYSVTLPPGYAGELKAGIMRIRCALAPGVIELECIRKCGGTTKDIDLKDQAGADCEPCKVGLLHGYHSKGAGLDRWALSEAKSNKLLLVRFKKNGDTEQAGLLTEPVIKNIRLK